MRILITGGTGFIGIPLAKSLPQDDHQIYILSRNPIEQKLYFNNNIIFLQWGGKTVQGWGHIIEEIDAVINLAGENLAGNLFAGIFYKHYTPERK